MRHEDIYNLDLHLKTAELLIKGVRESIEVTGSFYEGKWYGNEIPPEHSDESIVRRCIQIRQELLQVQKKLR